MIRITICDDSERDLAVIRAELARYEKTKQIKFRLSAFTSPANLVFALGDGELADLYILDVSMPGMDGFAVADEIRKRSETAVIVFLTSMADQAAKGYRSKALRYVDKSDLRRGLPEALDAAIAAIDEQDEKSVLLRRYCEWRRVPLKEIVSVARVSRQLSISTVSLGELSVSRGISEFYDELNDKRFLFIDRSCFVNIDHIASLSGGDSLTLTDGRVLPVSRREMPRVKQALLDLT